MKRYRRKHSRHRPRGWFSLFLRLGGWVCLILGAGLVAMTFFSASALYLADRLDRDGAIAWAVVEDKRVEIGTDSDGDEVRDHYVTFAFKTAGGGRRIETGVTAGYYDSVQRDDEVRIRYLIEDPSTIEYELGSYRSKGIGFRYAGLVLGLAGLAALWMFGKQANRAIRVRRDGQKRMAVVTALRDSSVQVNHRPQGRLVWREEDGQTGQSLLRDLDELQRLYDVGDPVVVFRLGRHAYWEGDVGPPAREV